MFDRFLNTIRLNDDYDDDFYDEVDDELEQEEEKTESRSAPKKAAKVNSRFSKKMDDFDDDEPVAKPKKKKAVKEKAAKISKADRTDSYSSRNSKITPIKSNRGHVAMEVCVIKPTSMEDTREIVDTLRDGCTVVLNLEALDVDIAQRIIDFVSGASYAVDGTLRIVSSYIFVLTPENVEITGDIQDIIGEAAPNIRTEF